MDLRSGEKIHWLDMIPMRLDGSTVVISTLPDFGFQAADLILISHDHFDHNSPEDLAKVRKSDSWS